MAPTSSSTKKAARLAQKGKGQKVRFQGGALFPVMVALVIVLGLALIVYARQTRPAADESEPQVGTHWHHTYGFFLCDQWVQLEGDAEGVDSAGRPENPDYLRTGIHAHDDGLMHWHPSSTLAVGRRATVGVFLDVYKVKLSNDKLEFPEEQRVQLPADFQETGVFEDGETQCTIDGEKKDAQLSVTTWNNTTDTGPGKTFISAFTDIVLDRDAMVVSIAFVPNGTDVGKPPWIADFDENVAIDTGQLPPSELFPEVSVDGEGDVIDGSVPTDSVGDTVSSENVVTAPVSTDSPTATTTAES